MRPGGVGGGGGVVGGMPLNPQVGMSRRPGPEDAASHITVSERRSPSRLFRVRLYLVRRVFFFSLKRE